jgi:lysophospholipase L1-like esterase
VVSQAVGSIAEKGVTEELVYAKMMGRYRDGTQLASDRKDNDFNYSQDAEGSKCPFHAHLRRSNPRVELSTDRIPEPGTEEVVIDLDGQVVPNNPNSILSMGVPSLEGARIPRIFRRGMSYGPRFDPKHKNSPSKQADRGLIFMAYNASISEQFEVVQRWISGGNSTGGFSGEKDPLLGVPGNGEKRRFRFEHPSASGDQVFRIDLDGADLLPGEEGPAPNYLGETKPFVRLEWGAYLFTPSLPAIKKIASIAKSAKKPRVVWTDTIGQKEIARLEAYGASHGVAEAMKEWKRVLEDSKSQDDWVNASVLSAIRKHHRGMYRAPGGVIVASSRLVKQVLLDSEDHYSVSGYHSRMKDSIGEIYLGLDKGAKYDKLSTTVNAALMSLSTEDTFTLARQSAKDKIDALIANEKNSAIDSEMDHWELTFNAREVFDHVLQELCKAWFGLPPAFSENASQSVIPAGPRWEVPPKGASRYPGDFTAPSRFIFQPWPGDEASRYGKVYGKALVGSFGQFVKSFADGEFPLRPDQTPAPVSEVIFRTFKGKPELITATLVGALMGMLPTLDGNLKIILNEWLKESTFWSLRLRLAELTQGQAEALDFGQIISEIAGPMHRAMQIRATPEYIWRMAKDDHTLGDLKILKGEKILISLISANQEALEQGEALDHFITFGGNRREAAHPTHACPGYSAAQGALLGVFSALLEVKDKMRPTPAPLAFKLEGPLPTKPPVPENVSPLVKATSRVSPTKKGAKLSATKASGLPLVKPAGELLAYGDSWLRGYSDLTDISEVLMKDYGYSVTRKLLFCFPGFKLSTLAGNLTLNSFTRYVQDLPKVASQRPKAILISAGGNDVKDETLMGFMFDYDPSKPDSQARLNDTFLKTKITEMRDQYRKIFKSVIAASKLNGTGASIPILVHGYANPIVDGRYLTGEARFTSWLWNPFAQRKYFGKVSLNSNPPQPDPTATAKTPGWLKMRENARVTMRQVIGAFNAMLEDLIKKEFNGLVIYIDLRKLFNEDPAFDYKKLWVNELHPTVEGYKLIGQAYANALNTLKTKVAATVD